MGNKNYWVIQQKLNGAKKRLLKLYPNLPDRTGIYILTREDENGFKYAYIGQTKNKGGILERMAEHLLGYQHIDRSLKAHKFIGEQEYGYKLDWFECLDEELDGYEQEYILKYANMGFQLRNKNSGGNKGKAGFENNKAPKGYFDGVAYGRQQMLKEVKEYFDKYLDYEIKLDDNAFKKQKPNKKEIVFREYKEIYKKKYNEFKALLEGNENGK